MSKIQEFIKQHLLFLLKISSLGLGLVYIGNKLQDSMSNINFLDLDISMFDVVNFSAVLLALSVLNWFGELKKWKLLSGLHSFSDALRQVLVSHGLSIFTPNKAGEYGGKCLFYARDERHRVIALTGVGHFCQLCATIVFGIIGFAYLPGVLALKFEYSSLWIIGCIVLGLGLVFSFKVIRQHLKIIITNLKQVKREIVVKTLFWSLFRYLVFSHQFAFLLWGFGADLNYADSLSIIFIMYFLSSIIPSFALSDVLVKGSIAITLFSLFGVESNVVLIVVFIMWLSNTMLPALLGYFMLMQWKPKFQLLKK